MLCEFTYTNFYLAEQFYDVNPPCRLFQFLLSRDRLWPWNSVVGLWRWGGGGEQRQGKDEEEFSAHICCVDKSS